MAMFSATDSAGTTFSSWWMKRSPSRCAAAGPSMLTTLPSMAIVRKEAFSNDQWPLVGAALLTVDRPGIKYFARDPSQIVRNERCRSEGLPLQLSLRAVPAEKYDYLWLINTPPVPPELLAKWQPVFADDRTRLFRLKTAGDAR